MFMVIKLKYWLIIATIFVANTANAQKYNLSGYLRDSLTNEFLIGATVQIENTSFGSSSNAYGYYSITVNKGKVTLLANYIGYEQKSLTIDVASNLTLDISLKENKPMFLFQPGVDLRQIVDAVNQVGASPSSLIAILEALKSSGSLRAELIVI